MPDLFAAAAGNTLPAPTECLLQVPRTFMPLAEQVICASDPGRFGLLYSLLWRLNHGEPHLLNIASDTEVVRAKGLAHAVHHDMHKMRAFLRFREVAHQAGTQYVAWFEPDHYIVDANAGFFQRRFAAMEWFILTPYRSLHWDRTTLYRTGGTSKDLLPDDDRLAAYWNAYFASTFNPARLKVKTMTTHMPRKYWKNMPETRLISDLERTAATRTSRMIAASHATARE